MKVLSLAEGTGKARVNVVARSAEGASGSVCAEDVGARTRTHGARIAGTKRAKKRNKERTVLRVTIESVLKDEPPGL